MQVSALKAELHALKTVLFDCLTPEDIEKDDETPHNGPAKSILWYRRAEALPWLLAFVFAIINCAAVAHKPFALVRNMASNIFVLFKEGLVIFYPIRPWKML
ncbi:hypothetical protein B0O99DRAFT_629336 [Bisporella sp. PMI_857]|nr:hypothetical protein B0O99DRAFT_629336 [Bisporella sp. PMI_857]